LGLFIGLWSSLVVQGCGKSNARDPGGPQAGDLASAGNAVTKEEVSFEITGDRSAVVRLTKGVDLELVLILFGEFTMGSPPSEEGYVDNEGPQHRVTISNPFYMGKYEVTQGQWKTVMGDNPSFFKDCGDNCSVEQVSWEHAQDFCHRLSNRTGREVRLPTEAEWEYACRAGTTTAYSFGSDKGMLRAYAWFDDNSSNHTHAVGQKQSNAWGLYDMHGNVWEWCSDWHGPYSSSSQRDPAGVSSGFGRVLRGGSWVNYPCACRSAHRYGDIPDGRDFINGLRVVVSSGTPQVQGGQ
jgi:formylglycine-generating enzyme required for sulfatase activity